MLVRILTTKLLLVLALLSSNAANAVSFPAYDIQMVAPGDVGYTLSASALNIDATVIGIVTAPGVFNDIPDLTFTLSGTGTYTTDTAGSFTFIDGAYNGSFDVGGGVLTGTFTNLLLSGLFDTPLLSGNVLFSDGSTGSLSLALNYNTASVAGKLGAVPVPAAAWLFGSAVMGLMGLSRRKR